MNNVLKGTRVYLAGQMQYFDGAPWRVKAQTFLESLGVVVFNPYEKPFINATLEDDKAREELTTWINTGEYEKVVERMTKVRKEDLRLCDISDFLFVYINPAFPTCGAWEELFHSNNQRKPIFFVVEGGIAKLPLWLFGVLPLKYVYSNLEESFDMIRAIDSGEKSIDSDRWRILQPQYIH
jgi:hypothetical protein